jgi:lysophospholipase L1-like esterase
MKRVLCYGDSNTWGYDPDTGTRFPPDVRWTGVLANRLGSGYTVIEEGLNGRTTRWDDPLEQGRDGLTFLRPCIDSQMPLDLLIVMLGTNDLKHRFRLTASDIAESAAGLAEEARRLATAQDGARAEVLLVAPPALTRLTDLDQMFDGARETSRQLAHYFGVLAGRRGLPWFDAGSVIACSDLDGIHFEADAHRTLGEALADEVRRLIG